MLTPGQILQNRRKELKKSLSVVSQETRIQERFLKYIEADDYGKFDSGVFVNGFIKIYADYLGMDVDRMLALYRRASKQALQQKRVSSKRKPPINFRKFLTPVNAVIALVLGVIIVGVIYLNIQFNKFQSAPEIEFVTPKNNSIIEEEKVTILGLVDENSDLFFEGVKLDLDEDGSFEKEVALIEGQNTFSFEAVNRNNPDLKTVETIRVEYRKPEEVKGEQAEEQPEQTIFQAYLEIIGEDTWVQYIVDDTQRYAQVLTPGKTETFEIKESVEVVTGKPQSTKLYINNTLYELRVNPDSGVASISCTVKGSTIDCSE